MIRLPKLIIASLLLSQLSSTAQLYEGFASDTDSEDGRIGFSTGWHMLAGNVGFVDENLNLQGFAQSGGALSLTANGEALAQVNADFTGTYYGSFRFQSARIHNDSIIGLLLARPDLEELSPKTANLGILAKGWGNPHGALLADGRIKKTEDGVSAASQTTYLVLFKVEDGSAGPRSIETWVLNADQAEHFAQGAFTAQILNKASLGSEAGAVMQRARLVPKPSARLTLKSGDMIACIAKFNKDTIFDELRISGESLRVAAGAL